MPAKTRKKKKPEQEFDLQDSIYIQGARANNLKNISLRIPKNELVVVTGLSGSGKSSLTMDTLYAEGQRRYVESLSSYARQFLGRMKKPDVDFIKGICPAIAIEQKVSTRNARSTVGTLTEIYDFLRLLYARVGKTYSPVSGEEVRKHQVSDVVDYILSRPEGRKVQLFAPLPLQYRDRTLRQELNLLLQKGYTRILWKDQLLQIQDVLETEEKGIDKKLASYQDDVLRLLIDRFVVQADNEENDKRIADSVQTAFYESEGDCYVQIIDGEEAYFNNRFELDGMVFLEPTPQLFNFNNPYGACPKCEGFSLVMDIDPEKVVPNPGLSVHEGAIACWKGEKSGRWLDRFLAKAHLFDFPVHRPYYSLSDEEKAILWDGNKQVKGIYAFFDELRKKMYKIQNRVTLARYRGRTLCSACKGGRLRPEASYVDVGGYSLPQLMHLPIDELLVFFNDIKLTETEEVIGKRLILEISHRLQSMADLGLTYLTLGRLSNSLSGGETQRINLTRTLGSNLTSSMYILDEPSIGLHPRDTGRMIAVLKRLRDLGNTVIVVEHEEDVIKAADFLVDIGPDAGVHGGELIFAGPATKIFKDAPDSYTAQYLNGEREVPVPKKRRPIRQKIEMRGAAQHNLKEIDVDIPLHAMTVVSGVSGSGKTTLIKNVLYPHLLRAIGQEYRGTPGALRALKGATDSITDVELISQSPIGRSSRSNPVTYVKAYDGIRKLMANQQAAKINGLKPKHFSFNVEGGRCDECQGEGEQVIEMQFLADVRLTCEVCNGQRFKPEVLAVQYNDRNIDEILQMPVEEALAFFEGQREITNKLQPLMDVGLGYVALGQSSSTLSGGEAQRVKLASFLTRSRGSEHILFIFDEPTTGLHMHDINKLLQALQALIENGHSVLIIEHNMEVIKNADWLIDLGPEGGKDGGELLFQGRPEEIVDVKRSYTAAYLKGKL